MPKTIILDSFRYISNEGWRALVAIEMGMKNHELVPAELAQKISHCKRTGMGFIKILKDQLIPNKLVAYESYSNKCSFGYRLTNLGYDYLALHQLVNSEQLSDMGSMIGAGKESDVYLGVAGAMCGQSKSDSESNPLVCEGTSVVIKFHRLGRTSFRKVKEKRDYHQHRSSCSWLYLDRLASQREFSMMKALHAYNLSVPMALAHNRNAVVMSYINDSIPLSRMLPSLLRSDNSIIAQHLYKQAREMLLRIASIGLIHGDLNEFNLMVVGLSELEQSSINHTSDLPLKLILIDFPQMISRDHPSADSVYQRDFDGVVSFFERFFDIPDDELPLELDKIERVAYVDVEVRAPGFPNNRKAVRGKFRTTREVLLGSTSQNHASKSSDSSLDDEDEISDEGSSSSVESGSLSDSSTASSDEAIKVLEKKFRKTKVSELEPHGLIDRGDIRAKYKQERRKQEQAVLQRQIKRRSRAHTKRQNHANITAELSMFG